MKRNELRAQSLGVDVGARTLFSDVSFVVGSGQMLVITGASGSGKTTLVRALMGIIQPNRGEVTLAGQPLTASSALKEGFAFVPQDFGLVSILTAIETIALPLQASSIGREEVRERSTRWLGALGLESCANRTVEKLSGGQRQRVAIARALAMEADLIVLDEPTAELDPTNRALVLSLLVDELTRGAMLIVVSHESDVIAHADPLYELPAF